MNLVNLLNPEIIVIGSGMSKMGDLLFEPTRQMVEESASKLSASIDSYGCLH